MHVAATDPEFPLPRVIRTVDGNTKETIVGEDGRQQLQMFEKRTKPALMNVRSQVIYNDLHSGNILVDPEEPARFTGIIDFGDIVKSPLIVDVAVASAYLIDDGSLPLARIREFLAGYSKVRLLTQDEVDLLYDLILTRNVMTIVISRFQIYNRLCLAAYTRRR